MSRAKVWYCVNCGYETDHRGRCHGCHQRLEASPLPELPPAEDEDDEVGYRVEEWEDADRGELIETLIRANVVHRFEDDELIVGAGDEEKVDHLLADLRDELDGSGRGAGDEGEESEPAPVPVDESDSTWASVRGLHDAAVRLREDPTDMQADADVAECSAGVFAADDFPSIDPDTWAAVGRVTRRLLGALGADEALEDEIRTQAGVLVKLLQPTADPAAAEESRLVRADGSASEEGDEPGRVPEEPMAEAEDAELEAPAEPIAEADEAEVEVEEPELDEDDEDDDEGEGLLPLDEDDSAAEVVYELPDWLPEQRANLSVMLDAEGIPHDWDGGNLVVSGEREADTDAVFARIENEEALGGEDDEARYRTLEELFAAADRLAHDPGDEDRRGDARAAIGAAEGPTPVGMDDVTWWQIRSRARSLLEALDAEAGAPRVAELATAVRDRLRRVV